MSGASAEGLTRASARPHRWFVTTQFVRAQETSTWEVDLLPDSLAHAKEMGTLGTACGLNASSWFKLWGLPFMRAGLERCQACQRVVDAQGDRFIVAP